MISNFAKLLQNLPGLSKQFKNFNKLGLCKFCIESKTIALKCANNKLFLKIMDDA